MARWLFVRLYYPAVIVAAPALALALFDAGLGSGSVVATTSLVFALLCFALERLLPETDHWRLDPAEAGADALHALLSNTIPTAIYRALFFASIVSASEALTARLGTGLWPLGWPILAQFALAVVIAELTSYWIHRFLHETKLWPLHAVHHCSPRMYFLLAVRKHPIQAFITYGGRLSVLWLLGVPVEPLGLYLVLTGAHSFVQHSNLPLRTGALGLVFATPELHRIHHANRSADLGSNYGDVLVVYDRLFGSFRESVPGDVLHEAIGLPGLRVPQTYWSHLRLPFAWARLHAQAS